MMIDFEELHEKLFALQDFKYKNFKSKILPTVAKEKIIGIRSAELLKFTKDFFDDKTKTDFLNRLPHKYFEEDLIHVRIISEMKNYDECIDSIKSFLPYIDNWAICDSLIPKIFSKHADKLVEEIKIWLSEDSTYTVRFAISMLMKFYLNDNFDKKYLQWVAAIRTNEYYIEMMAAWFFTEALIKHYKEAIVFLQENLLPQKIHAKTIQKAVESRRISDEQKCYLKTLRRRNF